MSMKLYAEKLGAALVHCGVEVDRIRPPDFLPTTWRRRQWLDKVDLYAGRFVTYPRIAQRANASLYHIIDHGQAYLLSRLDPSRTVVTCHDIILLVLASGRLHATFRPLLATRVLRHSLRRMKRTRWIVADSEQTRLDLATLVGIDPMRVRVIHPGLNFPFTPQPSLRKQARERWKLGSGAIALHVGQTGFYKNIEGCLRVVAKLRQEGIPLTLVRAGSFMQPDQQVLQQRLGLGEVVRELGPLSDEELAALYNAADVLLFPSLYEGFGWPPLEAMASGLPVVCSRSGSLPEVVGEAALTAEAEDVDGLAAQVAAVLENRVLAFELQKRGLHRASAFTWERTAGQMAQLYREVLDS